MFAIYIGGCGCMSDDWSLKKKSLVLDERGLIHGDDDEDIDYYTYYKKLIRINF